MHNYLLTYLPTTRPCPLLVDPGPTSAARALRTASRGDLRRQHRLACAHEIWSCWRLVHAPWMLWCIVPV